MEPDVIDQTERVGRAFDHIEVVALWRAIDLSQLCKHIGVYRALLMAARTALYEYQPAHSSGQHQKTAWD
jgi:hypothetical protein